MPLRSICICKTIHHLMLAAKGSMDKLDELCCWSRRWTHTAEEIFRLKQHSRLGLGEPCLDLAWTAAAHCSEVLWS